jgi:hypothetical protein
MPLDPVTGRRLKTGGRRKGTPNKSTLVAKEAIALVYARLQAEAGEAHGHFLDWARGNPTDFYRLMSRLLPRPAPAPAEAADPITAVRWVIVKPDGQVVEPPSGR